MLPRPKLFRRKRTRPKPNILIRAMQSVLTLCCFCLPKSNKVHPEFEKDESYKPANKHQVMTDDDDVSTCAINNNNNYSNNNNNNNNNNYSNKGDYSVDAVSTDDSCRTCGKREVSPDKTYNSCKEGVAIDETTENCDQDDGEVVNEADTYCSCNKDDGSAADVYERYARTKRSGRAIVGEAVATDKTTSRCDEDDLSIDVDYYSSSVSFDICEDDDDSTTDSLQGDSGGRTVDIQHMMAGVSYVIDKNGGDRNINDKKSFIIKSKVKDRLNRSQYENRGFITQEWDSSITLDGIQDESLVHIELDKLPTYAKLWEKNQILKISHEYTEPEYVINAVEYPHLFNNIVNRKF